MKNRIMIRSNFLQLSTYLTLHLCRLSSYFVSGFVSSPVFNRKSRIIMDYQGPTAMYEKVEIQVLDKLNNDYHSKNTKHEILSKSWCDGLYKSLTKEEEHRHGMPWKASIASDGTDNSPPLTYMAFWEWQMAYMKEHLSNLQVLPCSSTDSEYYHDSDVDFSYKENKVKGGRIVNLCLASDEYRKIRMTYYDAGKGCQVFNSLWYPRESFNLPVLGIDLLAFGERKFLAVVDFQPIQENERDHSQLYEENILKPIREKYPSMQGKMSSRFYDQTKFFSKHMLFSKFVDANIVSDDLYPAFQEYITSHVELVKSTKPDTDPYVSDKVCSRIVEYDTYSAERDPAKGPFSAMFGDDWAEEYVHGFLFSASKKI